MDTGSPEFRALNNDVILEITLNMLKTSDLLSCRMVDRKWNKGATSVLKRRTVYLRSNWGVTKDFNELFTLMKNSQDFPFCGFGLKFNGRSKGKTIDTVAARKFFGKFGSSFHSLYLSSDFISSRDVAILLSSFLPNIRTLELEKFHMQEQGEAQMMHESLDRLTLPALRRIKFRIGAADGRSVLAIRESDLTPLLRAATNLEKIEGNLRTHTYNQGILMAISATNNLNKLSSLIVENQAELNAGLQQSLVLNPPSSLTQLTLENQIYNRGAYVVRTEFEDLVRVVLQSSAQTLRSLVIGRVTLPMDQLPVKFWKLKTFEFQQRFLGEDDVEAISPGISSQYDKFPVLQEIRLSLECVSGESLKEHFWQEGTVWSSVVKLDLLRHVTPDGMKHLAGVFPCVTHIVIHYTGFFLGIEKEMLADLSCLRDFQSLEKLEILDIFKGSSPLLLDQFLTGMPGSVCHALRDRPRRQPCEDCSEILRPFGGLAQLRGTKLKELVLHNEDRHVYYYPGSGDYVISKVALWYGLEVIPGLRTVVKVRGKNFEDFARLKEPVKQFVTIDTY